MATIELIYDADCPNIEGAREHLLLALAKTQHKREWREWDRASEDSPGYVRHFGSPTVLVDGKDVAGESPTAEANCCRIYRDEEGRMSGVPSVNMIAQSLRQSSDLSSGGEVNLSTNKGGIQVLALLPAIGSVLLPQLTCPLCWPAYASLLSAVGLGFVDYTPYLLPLTAIFLLVAVVSIGYHARKRQYYTPLLIGVVAAMLVFAGKFIWPNEWMTYGSIAVLIGVSIWGTWPARRSTTCPAYV